MMDEERQSRIKKWGSLTIVFIIIISLSAALLYFLTPDQQSAEKTGNRTKTVVHAEEKTAHSAIVNEDQGTDFDHQKLILGNQMMPLFTDQDG